MRRRLGVFLFLGVLIGGTGSAASRRGGGYLAELSNFRGVDQKGFYWCWVAVTQSSIRQQTGIQVSQCRLANALTGSTNCCGFFNTSCDHVGNPTRALDQVGLNGPGKEYTGRVSGQRVLAHLKKDLPVYMHLRRWDQIERKNTWHVVTVYAIRYSQRDGWIYSIYDPSVAEREYSDSELNSLLDYGLWENTTFVGKFRGDEAWLRSLR